MKKKIRICCLLLILCGIVSLLKGVYAMTPTYPNDMKFSRGVGNVCYYVDSSANSYINYINTAINNWVDTGYGWNPIYVTPVSSNYATHIDVYSKNIYTSDVLQNNMLGFTSFWDINSNPIAKYENEVPPKRNYYYTEIEMNSSKSNSFTVGAVSHELGHAFGLNHSPKSDSVMYYLYENAPIRYVSKDDHDTINYLYN